jgi:hypothetical protein
MKEITSNEADRIIIRPNGFVMFLLGKLIQNTVARLIDRAFERGKISSHAYHELHAMAVRSLGPTKKQEKMLLPLNTT